MSDYKHVVIDEQKNIILPEELKNHMVQGDHNVKTIVFDCPRYSDGRDLSAMAIYICYIRADKEPGSDKAENITIDPEDSNIIHFEWIPKIDATLSSGILTFLVCAEKADEEGSLENGWHTKLCKDLKIAEGMDCLKAIAEKYPAIITYLITRMDDLEAGGTGGAGEGNGTGSGVSVQADYDQNDSTQPDYIKNRPFYTAIGTVFDADVETVELNGLGLYEHTERFDVSTDNVGTPMIVTHNSETYNVEVKYFSGLNTLYSGNLRYFLELQLLPQTGYGSFEEWAEAVPEVAPYDTGESFFLDLSVEYPAAFITPIIGTQHFAVSMETIHKFSSKYIEWDGGNAPSSLPEVTTEDNDKVLMVVNGSWSVASINDGDEVAY